MIHRARIDRSIGFIHGSGRTVKRILVSPDFYEKLKEEYNDFLSSFGTYQQRYDKELRHYRGCPIKITDRVPNKKDFWII